MRASIVIGKFWVKWNYPDTGVWVWRVKSWKNKEGKTLTAQRWYPLNLLKRKS